MTFRLRRICFSMALALVALGASGDSAIAAAPTHQYNKPGVTKGDNKEQIVNLAAGQTTITVRDGFGNPLLNVSGSAVQTTPITCSAPNANKKCVLVQRIEPYTVVDAGGTQRTMWYIWDRDGGNSGFVTLSDFATKPDTDICNAAGNGTAEICTNGVPTTQRDIPGDAPGNPVYKLTPTDINHGTTATELGRGILGYLPAACPTLGGETLPCSYRPYGRPTPNADYAMMVWSWPHKGDDTSLDGGGVARASFPRGTEFHPSDVDPIDIPTVNPTNGGAANGNVTVRFGWVKVTIGTTGATKKVYGWMTTRHNFGSRCYDHMALSGGTALAGTSCTSPLNVGLGGYNLRGDTIQSTVDANATLEVGDYLMSHDLRSTLIAQSDGNFALYRPAFSSAPWYTGTGGRGAQRLIVGADGNLTAVAVGANPAVFWSSNTWGNGPVRLTLQDDGNLALYRLSDNVAIWSSGTWGLPAQHEILGSTSNTNTFISTITGGTSLHFNDYLASPNRKYALTLQTDGNLVLYGPGYHAIWWVGLGSNTDTATMQTDGNFVTYRGTTATWYTATWGHPGAYLAIQNDGNLVVYDASNNVLWQTGTYGRS